MGDATGYTLKAEQKIGDWTFIKRKADVFREAGATIILTNGCFDILHPGHVAKLERAKAVVPEPHGLLIVSIDLDDDVRMVKGYGRPFMAWEDRARVVAALGCVDAVTWHSAGPCNARPAGRCSLDAEIDYLRPDVWAARDDFIPEAELEAAKFVSTEIVRIPRHGDYASSQIIDRVPLLT